MYPVTLSSLQVLKNFKPFHFYLQVPLLLLGTYSHFLKTNKNKTGQQSMFKKEKGMLTWTSLIL